MSQGKGIEIPVSVPGADAAQADIAKLGQAVGKVGQSGSQQAKGLKEASSAGEGLAEAHRKHGDAAGKAGGKTKEAGDAVDHFQRKGEILVKNVLSAINPELANMADFGIDAAEGIGMISPALLGVAAVGSGIALLLGYFKSLNDAALAYEETLKRVSERQREIRGEQVDKRKDLYEKFAAAGVSVSPEQISESRHAIETAQTPGGGGLPADIAEQSEVMRVKFGLTAEQLAQVRRGLAKSRGAEFTGDDKKDQESLKQVLDAGDAPDAAEALENAIASRGSRGGRPQQTRINPDALAQDKVLQRLKDDRPDLSKEQLEIVDAMIRHRFGPEGFVNDQSEPAWENIKRNLVSLYKKGPIEGMVAAAYDEPGRQEGVRARNVEGLTVGQLEEVARGAIGVRDDSAARMLGSKVGEATGAPQRPIQIIINNHSENVNNKYGPSDPFRQPAMPSSIEAMGLTNGG